MHEQGIDQDDPKASISMSKSSSQDITWPGDSVSSDLADGESHIQHPPNADQISSAHQILNQCSHNFEDLADTATVTKPHSTAGNTALTALRTEIERLKQAKEEAISAFDQDIKDVTAALRVVEKTGLAFSRSS